MADIQTTKDGSHESQPDTAAKEAGNKLAADATPAAPHTDKPGDAAKPAASKDSSIGDDIGSLITSALSSAESAVSTAMDYLPGVSLFTSHHPETKTADTGKPADKATTDAAASHKSDTTASTGTSIWDMATSAVSALTGKGFSFDLSHANQSISIDDVLKASGCDKGNACAMTPAPGSSFNLGNLTVHSTKKATNVGGFDDQAALLFGSDWQNVADAIYKETGTKINTSHDGTLENAALTNGKTQGDRTSGPAAPPKEGGEGALPGVSNGDAAGLSDATSKSTGHIEKTGDGFVHKNASGQVDFQRQGTLSIKRLAGGATAMVDATTGIETNLKPDGEVNFQRMGNGLVKFPTKTPGVDLIVDSKTHQISLTGPKGKYEFKSVDGNLVPTSFPVDTSKTDQPLPVGSDLLDKLKTAFKPGAKFLIFNNGMMVKGEDGNIITVGNDGSGTMKLDAYSVLVRTKEGKFQVRYNDGRKDQDLTEAQVNTMLGDPKVAQQLKTGFGILINFAKTHKLEKPDGTSITMGANGLTGSTGGVETTKKNDGTIVTNDHNTQIVTTISADHKDVKFTDENGAPIHEVKASPTGAVTVVDAGATVKDDTVTTTDGTVYSSAGIKFNDGTVFQSNGNITADDGTTYNTSGEAIAWESPTTGNAAADLSKQSQESQAQAQVSAAEGMAASVLGKVSSGHATAGEIASLLASFEKLGSLVSSLSQTADPSLMAAAVMAQGEVSSAIEIAYSELNTNIDNSKRQPVEAPQASGAGSGSRPLGVLALAS